MFLEMNECDWSSVDAALKVSATAGVVSYRPGESMAELLKRADAALYAGKRAGRNRVVVGDAVVPRMPSFSYGAPEPSAGLT